MPNVLILEIYVIYISVVMQNISDVITVCVLHVNNIYNKHYYYYNVITS